MSRRNIKTQVFVTFIIVPLKKRHEYRLKGLTLMGAQNEESSVFLGPGSLKVGRRNLLQLYHNYGSSGLSVLSGLKRDYTDRI
jgi:hypothetical protein